MKKGLCLTAVFTACLVMAGCDSKLSGSGPPYYTTAFQCKQKHSSSGWCFATPSKVYSSDYLLVGKGSVQDYIINNGKLCVTNKEGCISAYVEIKDRD